MERSEQQGSQRGIPRLSRLPLPRTTQAVNASDVHQDDVPKLSNIPRPQGAGSLRLKGNSLVSGATNQPLKSRYGWSQQHNGPQSPVREALQAAHTASLETTPPGASALQYVEGDENSIANSVQAEKKQRKPKPRPSLSERTVETLSQIPPSPSPSRRRSSISSTNGMLPPNRPASSLRGSRPSVSTRGRPSSPAKEQFRPPGRVLSPSSDAPSVPPIPDFGRIYTPPRAHTKGSMIARPEREVRRSISVAKDDSQKDPIARSKPSTYAYKAKSMYDLRAASAKSTSSKPPLSTVFKDPPQAQPNGKKLSTRSYFDKGTSESLMKPRSPGENVLATSDASPAPNAHQTRKCTRDHRNVDQTPTRESPKPTPKASLSLRETIAQAKAAQKVAAKRAASNPVVGEDVTILGQEGFGLDAPIGEIGEKTLQKRIDAAVTTGTLNIAAMGLKALPDKIHKMYDFDQDSKINWSEAVDLTKFIAADNELEDISDFFPDWSVQELQEDDEKSNQFGGLKVLDLRGNRLTKLPIGLRRLENLQTLILTNNSLTVDAFDIICQIPNLRELNMANNSLVGQIPRSLAQVTGLQSLDLHANRLDYFPSDLGALRRLQKLDVSDNQLSGVPIDVLCNMSLVELSISKNRLSGTFLQGMYSLDRLQRLDLASNRLQSLCDDVLSLPCLQTLTCDNNQLKELPELTHLASLNTLTASDNQISKIPPGFTGLDGLRTASFSANQIKTLDPLIAAMEGLTTFNVAANPLRERKYLAMATDDLKADLARKLAAIEPQTDVMNVPSQTSGVPSQETVDALSYTFKPDKGVLNLSSQNLSSVDVGMVDLTQPVHTIKLSNNDLTAFPEELLKHAMVKYSLKSLDISHNQSLSSSTYLSSDISLPALQSLYIVSTGLTSLEALTTHLSAPELRELNISCHRMAGHVPWVKAWFPSMTTLLATDNWFTSIDVEGIRGLEVVDVSNNDLDHLPPKIGELGNLDGSKPVAGRLRSFECSGNRFRVPRWTVIEKGTEAVLRDLRRMVPMEQVGEEWRD